ncbi:uncharacterized protein CMC5_067190 [Chondromyces crocatus]|uniref:NADP-dependent oxidoreductase domain-containing protein n=1 Tax=Chondromyces crocatus TaxID=52 RepID=A0A0K1EPE5_CHOCO|nr:uncharacterized protein CMC5_067190 [Chondromyces crocatus]
MRNIAYDAKRRIVTEAWSPLGRGDTLRNETVVALAAKHGKTPAQFILRWHLDLGVVAIPKSQDPARICDNLDLFDFALDAGDHAQLATLDRGHRLGEHPTHCTEEQSAPIQRRCVEFESKARSATSPVER